MIRFPAKPLAQIEPAPNVVVQLWPKLPGMEHYVISIHIGGQPQGAIHVQREDEAQRVFAEKVAAYLGS
jgi:hypothetical protein